MTIRGVAQLTDTETSIRFPSSRDYCKSPQVSECRVRAGRARTFTQASWSAYPKLVSSPGVDITFTFDLGASKVSLAEIAAKVVAVESYFQPPLGPTESVDWCAHRDKVLEKSRRRRGRLSDSSPETLLPYLSTTRRTPSARTLIERNRKVVLVKFVPTIQHKVVTLNLTIPDTQQASFRTDIGQITLSSLALCDHTHLLVGLCTQPRSLQRLSHGRTPHQRNTYTHGRPRNQLVVILFL